MGVVYEKITDFYYIGFCFVFAHTILQRTARLLRLFVQGMLSAESAVLLDFHTIRMSLLILGRVIVAALAFRASQGDSCTHSLYLQMMNYTPVIGSSSDFTASR